MAMIAFNRWLSSSSFSRRFFEETLGGSGCVATVSVSSRAPISSKFLKADFAGLCGSAIEEGGSVMEEVSGAASAVTTGAVTVGAVAAGAVAVGAVALDAATTGA